MRVGIEEGACFLEIGKEILDLKVQSTLTAKKRDVIFDPPLDKDPPAAHVSLAFSFLASSKTI